MTEHWEAYRRPDGLSGRELMRQAREALRARNENPPGTVPMTREPMQPWPPVPSDPDPAPDPAPTGSGVHVLRAPCPACGAAIGMPCFIPSHPNLRPNGGTHPSRRTVALHDPS